MIDDELRTLLRERAERVDLDPAIPRQLLRTARRGRRIRAAVAAVVSVAVVAAGAGIASIVAFPSDGIPTDETTPTPSPRADEEWRGVWPEDTREEAVLSQAEADAGHVPWRLDVEGFVRTFARQELGWPAVHFDDTLDVSEPDESGPLRLRIYSCDPLDADACATVADPERAVVTIERLLRRDATGIWSVTRVRGPMRLRVQPPDPGGTVAESAPDTFVGFAPGEGDPVGRVELVETATGDVVRTILDEAHYSEGFGEFALAPDRGTLYYTQGTSACTNDLYRIAVAGGAPELVAESASSAAVSPDGTRLGYATDLSRGCEGSQELVIRDLATGQEIRWGLGYEAGAGAYGVCRLAWLPDSRRLAFNNCAEEGDTLHLLDVETDQGIRLADARRLGPADRSLSLGGFHAGSNGIAVRSFCMGPALVAGTCQERAKLVSIDAETGEVAAELVELPDATHEITVDASGAHFLLVDWQGRVVYAWSGEGGLATLAEGYSAAAW